ANARTVAARRPFDFIEGPARKNGDLSRASVSSSTPPIKKLRHLNFRGTFCAVARLRRLTFSHT
ncbi:MAG: hypothetical protein AAF192_18500, partial [Pseudomonadota bacterium]